MLYFLKIYIYKNTRNHHQCHSILAILFYFFLSWARWVKNLNFQKMKKTSWGYHFTQVHHNSNLSYWLWWMDFFFVILDQCFHFNLIFAWRIKLEKKKKTPADIISHLQKKNHDMTDVWFLRYRVWQAEIFCHFETFFALLHP